MTTAPLTRFCGARTLREAVRGLPLRQGRVLAALSGWRERLASRHDSCAANETCICRRPTLGTGCREARAGPFHPLGQAATRPSSCPI